jgi:Uma2 family endonuclease
VQDHSPIDAGPDSQPEPDVAVVRGDPRDLLDRHPSGADLALVVEISVTSHAEDRAKAAVYARAGVPEYWQLDVPARRVVVRTEPDGVEYRATRLVADGEEVVHGSGVRVPVAALLP